MNELSTANSLKKIFMSFEEFVRQANVPNG